MDKELQEELPGVHSLLPKQTKANSKHRLKRRQATTGTFPKGRQASSYQAPLQLAGKPLAICLPWTSLPVISDVLPVFPQLPGGSELLFRSPVLQVGIHAGPRGGGAFGKENPLTPHMSE